MGLPHRYTGCWPPLDVLAVYPNWVYALDEEDVEGQDETTIRPQDQQIYISEETDATAAEFTLATGNLCDGVILLLDGAIDAVDFFDGTDWWALQFKGRKWQSAFRDKDRPIPIKSIPIIVTSKLPLATDERISFTISANGASNARKRYL